MTERLRRLFAVLPQPGAPVGPFSRPKGRGDPDVVEVGREQPHEAWIERGSAERAPVPVDEDWVAEVKQLHRQEEAPLGSL